VLHQAPTWVFYFLIQRVVFQWFLCLCSFFSYAMVTGQAPSALLVVRHSLGELCTCYKGAAKVLHRCCTGVAKVLHMCWKCVAKVLERCCTGAGNVLHRCWKGARNVLHRCWKGAGNVLHRC